MDYGRFFSDVHSDWEVIQSAYLLVNIYEQLIY